MDDLEEGGRLHFAKHFLGHVEGVHCDRRLTAVPRGLGGLNHALSSQDVWGQHVRDVDFGRRGRLLSSVRDGHGNHLTCVLLAIDRHGAFDRITNLDLLVGQRAAECLLNLDRLGFKPLARHLDRGFDLQSELVSLDGHQCRGGFRDAGSYDLAFGVECLGDGANLFPGARLEPCPRMVLAIERRR